MKVDWKHNYRSIDKIVRSSSLCSLIVDIKYVLLVMRFNVEKERSYSTSELFEEVSFT